MKKLLLLTFLFIVGAIAFNPAVFAADYHAFSLSPEISYIKYEEPDVMKERGLMYGIDGDYTYYFDNLLLWKQEGRFSYGQVDYKNSGILNNIDDYMVELRSLVGYEYRNDVNSTITPYIGIGYRYLNDDMSGKTSSTGAKGYEREIAYLYTPIGMEFANILDERWSFRATFEYDLFWGGWVKSHLSDVNLGYNDLENTQKRGYGLRASLKFLRNRKDVDLIIEPFIRYWNIGESDYKAITYYGTLIDYGYEPRNDSTEVGLMITYQWGSGREKFIHPRYTKSAVPPTDKTEIKPAGPKVAVSSNDYYEAVRRDIALAISGIKTAEKGHARINFTLSPDGRILAFRVVDDNTTLSDSLRKEITDLIYAVAPFPGIPASIYKSEISFSVPIVFE